MSDTAKIIEVRSMPNPKKIVEAHLILVGDNISLRFFVHTHGILTDREKRLSPWIGAPALSKAEWAVVYAGIQEVFAEM